MLEVPLSPIPAQSLGVVLAQQNCQINVYQKTTGLFFDLLVDNVFIVSCVIGRDGDRMVRQKYRNFIGDFTFIDTQGSDDPVYTGLGSRWVLIYMEAADLLSVQ